MAFCATSPAAAIVTVWPSGTGQLDRVQEWIKSCGGNVLHSAAVPLATSEAELLTVMALYDGEDWLESNCWYMEQPLPGGPPDGPYAGAKWKRELCFKNVDSRAPHAIVVDVGDPQRSSLWAGKYAIRSELARLSGNPGNSCIHLTDRQTEDVLDAFQSHTARSLQGGMGCDDSFAYSCARALLHPESINWLNSDAAGLAAGDQLGSAAFRGAWAKYTAWLHAPRRIAYDATTGAGEEAFDAPPAFV